MKKLIALLMALAMMLALVACGSSASDGGSSAPAASSAPDAAAASTSAGEPEDGAAEESGAEGSGDVIGCEALDIIFNTTYNETETGGEIIKQWIAYLDEYSGGTINADTVTVYWGGTVYGDPDVLDALSSGAINMTTFGHMPHTGTLNYLGFPGFAPGGTEEALAYFSELMFNDPETSALIQDEAAENGIIYLNVLPGGANAFCATYEFSDLASLVSNCRSFGNMDAAIFEKLGFQVTSVGPGDCYDALQRGLIDATQMGLTPMVSMQWYDIADYWALDGTYSAGNFISANLDWWNSLSADQQAVIRAASDSVQQWSLEKYDAAIGDDIAAVETATGNPMIQFSDEEIAEIWAANFESKAAAALTAAEPNGKTEGMVTILEKAAEITGYDWNYEG